MFCSGFPPFILTAIIEAYTCKYPNWPLKALVETIKQLRIFQVFLLQNSFHMFNYFFESTTLTDSFT